MVRRFPGMPLGGFHDGRRIRPFAVLALLGLALLSSGCSIDEPQSTIIQNGEPNERIWFVYNFLWIGAAVVFILVEALLVYAIFRYRRAPKTAHGRPVPVHGNTKLEILWTIIPAIVLVFIAIPTLGIIAELADAPDEEDVLEVDVIGHQFFFEFIYPDLDIQTTNTLHIPEDTVIDLNLFSEDVIHSFWVPQLAGKTDNIPGRINEMWLTAEEPGVYEGQCAEFCGVGHALMRLQVEAHTQEDFAAWVAQQQEAAAGGGELAAVGQQLAQANGCIGCHSIDGETLVGPTWLGLFGSEVPLASGETVIADEEYITRSIREPDAQIHEGFPAGVMQPFGEDALSDEDIQAIIAYMQTLSESQ